MGFIKYVISLVMVIMFALSIIFFSIGFGTDNDAGIKLSDEEDFSTLKTDLAEGTVQITIDDFNSTSGAYFESTVEPGDETTSSGGQFKVGIGNTLDTTNKIVNISWKKIFGSDSDFSIVLSAITGVIVFIGVMLGYKAWIGRNPE